MKNILITNDDGFHSPTLIALAHELKNMGRVIIVAPANEKSACGHGLTLTKPLHLIEIEKDYYKLEDGTPSDCIYIALNTLYKDKKPDLVISGINIGSNMGEDVTYSGTVAGAMEAAIRNIPSMAISQVLSNKSCAKKYDFSLAIYVTKELTNKILNDKFPLNGRKFINVNIPQITKDKFKGYKITQLGYRIYGNDALLRKNPRGEEYFWLGLHPLDWKERSSDGNSDFKAVFEGYASITPIMLDLTSYNDMETLIDWVK